MSTNFIIEAVSRSDEGKGASRRLRREGNIPAVIYGGGKDPMSLTIAHDPILHSLENEAFYTSILQVSIDGKTEKAILRDVQRHPYKPKIAHIDLQRVSDTDKVHMLIPLHFVGEEVAPGVKAGGMVSHTITELNVVCAAKDLPDHIEVDVSGLELEGVLHISDLQLPKGVESVDLMHGAGHDQPVAAIHKTRATATEEAGEEAPEEGGEE